MPFGEYELSPSLIGLSLLHTAHPEAFQRLLVRASIPCYRDFTLAMCRSLGFASATADSTPSSGSLSLRVRASSRLASPATATRRFIMQKARRHHKIWLRPLVGAWFQELSLSVSREYLALPDGPGGFTQGSTCPALLRIPVCPAALRLRSCHPLRRRFPAASPRVASAMARSYYPGGARKDRPRFGLFPVRSPLLGESLLFSLPGGTKMFQFPPFASINICYG